MKFGEFMAALQKGSPKHVYLLGGEEHYYIEKARNRILEKLFPGGEGLQESLQRIDGDAGLETLMGMVETAPFFADKNVILWKNAPLFRERKAGNGAEETAGERAKKTVDRKMDRFLNLLSDMPEYSYLIFVMRETPDRRRKLYKTVEKVGAVLEAEPVRPWNINEWLQGKLQSMNRELDREAYLSFAVAVSMMQRISLEYLDKEFDKLAFFSQERRIGKEAMEKVFAGVPEVSVFALMDAISARDAGRALTLLRRQVKDGVYLPLILNLMARHVRQLWQAKTLQEKGCRGKALARPLELNPVIAERLGKAAEGFPSSVLKRAMLELTDGDYFLKTGQAGEEILENIVIGLCRTA